LSSLRKREWFFRAKSTADEDMRSAPIS